jgi:hydroxyacylglutathione hydrolase
MDRKTLVDALRLENTPTVPTTVELEKKTNPFLRANQEQIKTSLNMNESSDIEVFAEIRKRKDNF